MVEDSIFCVHGGVGQTLKDISTLQHLEKPIKVNHQPKAKLESVVY